MICTSCKVGKLITRNTYVTPNGKTARLECPNCGEVYCATTVVSKDPAWGQGAYAQAKRLNEKASTPESA